MSAEMAARRTAAAALLADYGRALDSFDTAGVPMHWATFTGQLAWHVRLLLEATGPVPVTLAELGRRAILRLALTDAIEHRDSKLDAECILCELHLEGLCAHHAADLNKADAYLALARELGIEVAR